MLNKKIVITLFSMVLVLGLGVINLEADETTKTVSSLTEILESKNTFNTVETEVEASILDVYDFGDSFIVVLNSGYGMVIYQVAKDGSSAVELVNNEGAAKGETTVSEMAQTADGQYAIGNTTCYGDAAQSGVGYVIGGAGELGFSSGSTSCEPGQSEQYATFAHIVPLNDTTFMTLGVDYGGKKLVEYTFSATESTGYPENKKNFLDTEGYNFLKVKFLTPLADGTFRAGVEASVNEDGSDAKYLILNLDSNGDLVGTPEELPTGYSVYDVVVDQTTGQFVAPYYYWDGSVYNCGLLQLDEGLNVSGKIDLFTTSDFKTANSISLSTTSSVYNVVQKDITNGYYWTLSSNGEITNSIKTDSLTNWAKVITNEAMEEKYFFTEGNVISATQKSSYAIVDGHAPNIVTEPTVNIGVGADMPNSEGYQQALLEAGLNDVNPFHEELGDITPPDSIDINIVDDSSIDMSKAGSYTTKLLLTDEVGNSRKVDAKVIVHDVPTITANSSASIDETDGTVVDAQTIIDAFAPTATDDSGKDISADITTDTSSITDFSKVGDYPLILSITDEWGSTTTKDVTLTINDLKPKLTVTSEEQTITLGDDVADYTDLFGVVATEITDGDLTESIVVDDSKVELYKTGTYPVTFTVVDEEGTEVSKEVSLNIVRGVTTPVNPVTPVVDGDMLPVINSNGTATTIGGTELSNDELIALFEVTATDKEDGDLSSDIVVDQSAVDYNTSGDYDVEFSVIDSYGHVSVELVTLTVTETNTTDDNSEISSETETDDSFKAMNLASTGGITIMVLLALILALIGLLVVRLKQTIK